MRSLEPLSIGALLKEGSRILQGAVPSHRLDTELLLAAAAGIDRVALFTHPEKEVTDSVANNFFKLIEKRRGQMPVQYILQKAEFMGLDFFVDERVLIPRADTEILAEKAVELIGDKNLQVLELGTGSGALACTVARYCKNAAVTATDLSPAALDVAKQNAVALGVDHKICFLQGDLFAAVESGAKFDALLSNPPYIAAGEIPLLDKNVKDFEPITALDGGKDGLDFYRRIAAGLSYHLQEDGFALLEIGYDQGEAVKLLAKCRGYSAELLKDLSGHDRVIILNNI